MATFHISEDEANDFEDELPTKPIVIMRVEKQLNTSQSIARFAAALEDRGYHSPKPKQTWFERLSFELESAVADQKA